MPSGTSAGEAADPTENKDPDAASKNSSTQHLPLPPAWLTLENSHQLSAVLSNLESTNGLIH